MDIQELYGIYLEHPVVTTDSRNVPEGSLFFALRGDSFDGNLFAADAITKGAAYALVDNSSIVPATESSDKYIIVSNVLSTLQELGAYHRRKLAIPVVAITGTNGKTTTKELTAAVLSVKYNVYATSGNLNNHIGVPLTLLSIPADAEIAVIEMGASAKGEIAALCEIAAPDYGLITNIGRAHLEGFGGADSIKSAKGELYDYLADTGGTAVICKDDKTLQEMASERPSLKTVFYDTYIISGIDSRLNGEYNLYNMAAAAEIGSIFGISSEDISGAISNYEPSSNRSRIVDTGKNILIADCYNANPSSMEAALSDFIGEKEYVGGNGKHMKKMAILGDMLELGQWSLEEHSKIINTMMESGIHELILVGQNFHDAWIHMFDAPKLETAKSGTVVGLYPNIEALHDNILKNMISNRFILLKGSRGMALERLIPLL